MPSADSRWTPRTFWMLLGCAAIAAFGLFAKTYSYYGIFARGTDSQLYYVQARSLVVDGDLALTNDVALAKNQNALRTLPRARDGRPLNFFTFGWAAVSLPVMAGIHSLVTLAGAPVDRISALDDVGTSLWHVVLALIGLAFVGLTVARLTRNDWQAAAFACLAIFWATNVAYYTSVWPMMNHAASFAFASMLVYVLVRLQDDPFVRRLWWMAAGCTYVLVLLRPTDAILLILVIPAVRTGVVSGAARRVARFVTLPVMAIGAAYATQILVWRASLGYWTTNAYADFGFRLNLTAPRIVEALVGDGTGGWYFHPIYLVGTCALAWLAARSNTRRALPLVALIGVMVHIYVHSSYSDWAFGYTFGYRILVNTAPLVAMGLGVAFGTFGLTRRRVAWAGLMVLTGWNLLLMVSYETRRIPPAWPVPPAQLWSAQRDTLRWLLDSVDGSASLPLSR